MANIECPICRNPYHIAEPLVPGIDYELTPYVLNCGHSLCYNCCYITRIHYDPKCPVCRQPIELTGYRKNFALIGYMEKCKELEAKVATSAKKYKELEEGSDAKLKEYRKKLKIKQDQLREYNIQLDDCIERIKAQKKAIDIITEQLKNQKKEGKSHFLSCIFFSSSIMYYFFRCRVSEKKKKKQ